MSQDCLLVRRHLDAFVDGELRGPVVLRVWDHLKHCAPCAAQADEVRQIGELLRTSAEGKVEDLSALAGLAGTVVTRTRAEGAQSWGGLVRRAGEDWHWVLVGAGSLAATLIVTIIASAVLAFGPKPQREESLAAIVTELALPTPSGYLFADVKRAGSSSEPVMMQLDNGRPRASAETVALAANGPSNAEMVGALFDATHWPRRICSGGMDAACRRAVEGLSTEITRALLARGTPALGPVEVGQIRLVESVVVHDRISGS
jgi:anti-sigma factor RsiW